MKKQNKEPLTDTKTLVKTDKDRNDIVIEHIGIIYYMANRYRHLDEDSEELQGWCYYGFALALDKYETDNKGIELASLAFNQIKKTLYSNYYKSGKLNNDISLNQPAGVLSEGVNSELGDFQEDEYLHYDEHDIMNMLQESLFEEQGEDKNITIDYLLNETTIQELSKTNKMTIPMIRRVTRRGQDLIKTYLSNNAIISDYLLYPDDLEEVKKHEYKKTTQKDMGKIKYIKKYHPFLNANDIATIIDVSPYIVESLLNYPTVSYLRSVPDETIKEVVDDYVEANHPGLMASEVKTYNIGEVLIS